MFFYASTDCIRLLTSRFVLSGSSARSCFCVSLHPLCASRYRGLPPDTCRSGLSADSLWTAQPLARICEQPRRLHCFCRCYGSSRRGDRTICVAEDSAPLWLPVEALFTCLVNLLSNKTSTVPASESCLSFLALHYLNWCGVRNIFLSIRVKLKKSYFGFVFHNKKKIWQVKIWWMVDDMLSWKDHIDTLCKRVKQRVYFLRRLRFFRVSRKMLLLFFVTVIMSILHYCNTAWFKVYQLSWKQNCLIT